MKEDLEGSEEAWGKISMILDALSQDHDTAFPIIEAIESKIDRIKSPDLKFAMIDFNMRCYIELGDKLKIEDCACKILTILAHNQLPEKIEYHEAWTEACYILKEYDAAIESADKAIESFPDANHHDLLIIKADALYDQKKPGEALEAYGKGVLAFTGEDVQYLAAIYLRLGEIYYSRGEFSDAVTALQQAVGLYNEEPAYNFLLAKSLLELYLPQLEIKQEESWVERLREPQQIEPADLPQNIRKALDRASELDPENPDYYEEMIHFMACTIGHPKVPSGFVRAEMIENCLQILQSFEDEVVELGKPPHYDDPSASAAAN